MLYVSLKKNLGFSLNLFTESESLCFSEEKKTKYNKKQVRVSPTSWRNWYIILFKRKMLLKQWKEGGNISHIIPGKMPQWKIRLFHIIEFHC